MKKKYFFEITDVFFPPAGVPQEGSPKQGSPKQGSPRRVPPGGFPQAGFSQEGSYLPLAAPVSLRLGVGAEGGAAGLGRASAARV